LRIMREIGKMELNKETNEELSRCELGNGYQLVIEAQKGIQAKLMKGSNVIWISSTYPNFIEGNAVTIGEEVTRANTLPPELGFQNKLLIPILEEAQKNYLNEAHRNPLDFIDRALEKTIKYDKMHRRLVFLGMLSTYGSNPLNVALKAEPTTGKSWIMTQTATFFPEEDVMKYCDASPTAFYWKFGKMICKDHGEKCSSKIKCTAEKYKKLSFRHKILMFLDQPNDVLLQHMKPLLSHDEKILIRLATDPNKRGHNKASEVHLEGWPALCYASCQQNTDPEIASRTFIISPVDSIEKIREVTKFQAIKEKDPHRWRIEYENNLAVTTAKQMIKELKKFVERYRQVEIEKPYIEKLEEEFNIKFPQSPRSMRAFPQLLSLIDAITLLNYQNRTQTDCEDGYLKLTSTREDANMALEVLEYFLEGLKYGLSSAIIDVYSNVVCPLIKENGPVSRRDVVLKYRAVKGRYLGEKYISRYYLEPLVDVGLLNAYSDPQDRRRTLYSLNQDKIMEPRGGGIAQLVVCPMKTTTP